jgi:hypothetical protein
MGNREKMMHMHTNILFPISMSNADVLQVSER